MSLLGPATARRRFVALTALRWLRVGPTVAVLAARRGRPPGRGEARTDLLGLLAAGIFVAAAAGSGVAPRVGGWFGRRLGRAVTALVMLQAVAVVALGLAPGLPAFTMRSSPPTCGAAPGSRCTRN